MHRKTNHWDERYLNLARLVSTWSKDPSTKVGAVLVDDKHRVISLGYNGFPRGVEDRPERLENRELKYKFVVHAESNALLFAQRSVAGSSLYLWPFMPCATCAGKIIQAGVYEVIAPRSDNERWRDEFAIVDRMLYEADVKLLLINVKLEG